MKAIKLLPCLIVIFALQHSKVFSQCNTTNATSCACPNGQSNCDLLPDITISWYALSNYQTGPTEYSQTGNGANDGRLRLSGSTPNIGLGPLTVRSQDNNGNKLIVCGTDTFTVPGTTNFTCPNGATPKQILRQRILVKNGNTMTYREHLTPPQTYSNSSMYVDDWGIYSLRLQLPGEPNPRNWPIVGSGKKRAFCLMDYGSCTYYNGHCRDDNTMYQGGTTLLNGDFPNWGLGGGSYNCSAIEQGISSGYTDIYSENLDGMWITIPPNTCNGDYWIFYEVDPHNYFEEADETNNFTMIPFTLTLQNAPGNPVATIASNVPPFICGNDSITLTANAGFNYLWSNGATTQTIKVQSGTYLVTVTDHCGTAISAPFTVTSLPTPPDPITTDDSVCIGGTAQLSATGANISWFDGAGNPAGTGNLFVTPALTNTTTYFAQDLTLTTGMIAHGGKTDSTGGGGFFTGTQSMIFTAIKPFLLKSVDVFSNATGTRVIEVYTSTGQLIQSGTFNIPTGAYTVPLNFNIPQGIDMTITVNGTPNLWRNNAGVSYPYTITDTLSITGSSAGAGYYYFFYNWEIEVGRSSCASPLIPATAFVDVCSGINYAEADHLINVYPNPASETINLDLIPTVSDEHATATITDLQGRILKEFTFNARAGFKQTEKFNISDLPRSVLMVKIRVKGIDYYRRLVLI